LGGRADDNQANTNMATSCCSRQCGHFIYLQLDMLILFTMFSFVHGIHYFIRLFQLRMFSRAAAAIERDLVRQTAGGWW
jgi:hypothetical protein